MNFNRDTDTVSLTGNPETHHIDEASPHRKLTLLRENYVGFGPYCRRKTSEASQDQTLLQTRCEQRVY
ncbi:hypothetical protein F3J36_06140 [Pantoea sp. Cy-640]|nr:hypothetical protein [Pantoea sp. Cy-640]